jgi:pimeloyl-ACP methyl ester carboxylesterase
MVLEGVDVSVFNGLWSGKERPAFAIVRACYGTGKDAKYDLHVARFKSLGILTGAYAFGINMNGTAQARAFLTIAKNAAFIALDLETEAAKPRMTDEQAKAFIAECHRQGRKVGLYHSRSGFPLTLGQDWNWVADYRGPAYKPNIPFAIWQWQGSPLDRNHFYGTKAQLVALGAPYGAPVTPPPPPPVQTGNPYPIGSIESVQWYHDHGFISQGGVWVKVSTPPPAPTPTTPPPAPVPAAPPIPTTPTSVGANVGQVTYALPRMVVLAGLQALDLGPTNGPVYVLVHGGPVPLGNAAMLQDLAQRLANRGARVFCIDYRSDTWQNAVADVTAAVADVKRIIPARVTLVSHSYGGFPAAIAFFQNAAADAYVAVNAICSTPAVSENSRAGAPDIFELTKLRPGAPVSVVEGMTMPYPATDDKPGFVRALNAAGHPGFWTQGPGDHTGTLYTSETVGTIMQTAALIR